MQIMFNRNTSLTNTNNNTFSLTSTDKLLVSTYNVENIEHKFWHKDT